MKKPCDIAKGEKTKGGYIRLQIRVNGKRKKVRAHRKAWEETYGPIPPGKFVLHKCDTRACREPTHLFLGTHQDNMDDMVRKGRHTVNTAKLTEEQAETIRKSTESGEALARKFGVHPSTVSRIRRGKRRMLI